MMQAGSMKALMGASSNINLVNTPMRVFKEAENRGDTETMKRAMGYAAELGENAEKDAVKLGEETVKETREARKQQEIEREQAIAKTRQKNKTRREQALNSAEKPTVEPTEITNATAADRKAKDSVEISDSGKAAIAEQMLSGEVDMLVRDAVTVLYSSSAKTQPLEQPQAAIMDVKG
ncbi:MAG: hypothetical protein K2K57_06335 [Oscillospiraceae bacterium]|nr:hypothetical protein [Oscillospiraceae bacterium]